MIITTCSAAVCNHAWRRYVNYYINGALYQRFVVQGWSTGGVDKAANPYAPFDQPFHIILNLAVRGTCGMGDT